MMPALGMDALVRASFGRGAPRLFLSPEAEARVLEVAAAFPAEATDFLGYECRLGGRPAAADFLFCVGNETGAPEALAGALAGGRFAADAWAVPRRLCDAWRDGAACRSQVETLWFEFDLTEPAGLAGGIPVPSVFLGVPAGIPALDWLPDRAEWFVRTSLPAPEWHAIRACLAALPRGARLFQLGLMLSRPTRAARLCVRDVARGAIAGVAEAMGWRGAAAELAAIVALADETIDIRLGLDVGGRVMERIGVELAPVTAAGQARIHAIVMRLGLACEAELAMSAAWWGVAHRRVLHDAWDPRLDSHPSRPSGADHGMIARTENHIKITIEANGTLSAKTYLGARLMWLGDEQMRATLRAAAEASR